jgi:hypothetical protein
MGENKNRTLCMEGTVGCALLEDQLVTSIIMFSLTSSNIFELHRASSNFLELPRSKGQCTLSHARGSVRNRGLSSSIKQTQSLEVLPRSVGRSVVPLVFGRNLQCELVRKVDTREECHWTHACTLQANMRVIQ